MIKRRYRNINKPNAQKNRCLLCKYIWFSLKYPSYCENCRSKAWDLGDNVPCYCCKKLLLIPIVHHKDGNHENNSLENRIPICSNCHLAVHNLGKSNRVGKRMTACFSKDKERMRIIDELRTILGLDLDYHKDQRRRFK